MRRPALGDLGDRVRQPRAVERLGRDRADRAARLAQALARELRRGVEVAAPVGAGAARVLERLELGDDPGQPLRERVVDLARHPLALLLHAAVARLLDELRLQRRVLGERRLEVLLALLDELAVEHHRRRHDQVDRDDAHPHPDRRLQRDPADLGGPARHRGHGDRDVEPAAGVAVGRQVAAEREEAEQRAVGDRDDDQDQQPGQVQPARAVALRDRQPERGGAADRQRDPPVVAALDQRERDRHRQHEERDDAEGALLPCLPAGEAVVVHSQRNAFAARATAPAPQAAITTIASSSGEPPVHVVSSDSRNALKGVRSLICLSVAPISSRGR